MDFFVVTFTVVVHVPRWEYVKSLVIVTLVCFVFIDSMCFLLIHKSDVKIIVEYKQRKPND